MNKENRNINNNLITPILTIDIPSKNNKHTIELSIFGTSG